MSKYPEDEQGRKKVLAVNKIFHEPLNDDDNVEHAELIDACKKLIEIKSYLDSFSPYDNKSEKYKLTTVRSHGNLQSAYWHVQQALKVMHEDCTEDELVKEMIGEIIGGEI